MSQRTNWLVILLFVATAASGQQSIYWKKDHIYSSGPGGKEIAIITPAPADQTVPTAPSGLSSSNITATSIQLNWTGSTDSGGSGLAGYKIYRQLGTGVSLPVGTVGPSVLSFTDQPLTPHTSYNFTIVAFDNAQNHSAPSTALTVTTMYDDPNPPLAPASLTATLVGRNAVRLDWPASTDIGSSGTAGYRIYRGGSWISGPSLVTSLTYQDSNLAYRTTYSYTVVAVDNNGNASSPSPAASITTDWELVFQDDFNRADFWQIGGSWDSSYCRWSIRSSMAYTGGSTTRISCQYTPAGDMYSFRASIDVIDSRQAQDIGISFWNGAAGWRAGLVGTALVLIYDPDTQTNGPGEFGVGYAGSVGVTGNLRVEANSATRNIKVYWDGVLKINYTETDTSRPNSGSVGFTTYRPSSAGIYVDNFVLER